MGPGMERVRDADHLMKMLVSMARNKIVDELRQRTESERSAIATHCTEEELERATKLNDMPRPPTASQFAIARERWEHLLENQPQICQQLLALRLSGYTYEEISTELGINERTARRIIARLMEQEAAAQHE
jgi:RNA polymerase sigma factor (sigma-70 family)